MSGKTSRTKGHSFEREISSTLRVVFPGARRQLEYHANDALGIDIADTGPYKIQCKRKRKYASLSAIKEVVADEMLGDIPVLITKADNERTLVVIPLEAFMELLIAKYGKRDEKKAK